MDNPMIKALEERASRPFTLVGDDLIVGVFLLACFLLAMALADHTHYLKQLVANYSIGHPRSLSEEVHTSRSFYMRLSLLLLAVVSISLVLVILSYASGHISSQSQAFSMLLWGMAGITAWMLVKTLLYSVVNIILSTPQQTNEWNQVYTDTFIILGILALVYALVGLFFNVSVSVLSLMALALLVFVEIWLSFKAFHIFFLKKYGGLLLIVYLCTLEWIPLLVVGKIFLRIVL